ncbi:MAG: hypothetical protein C4523_10480 [Myxococcales bacterium]|nr:MAG: hypothetical protein C4523_10480 [Myxococcales bacterium]
MTRAQTKKATAIGCALALAATFAVACTGGFEDDTFSRVVTPRVLSIVLEPPEAAPGETVVASFLAADEKGPRLPPLQLWFKVPPDESGFASAGLDFGADVGGGEGAPPIDPESMGFMPTFNFTVAAEEKYTFDAAGLAPQLITLFVPRDDKLPPLSDDPDEQMEQFQKLLDDNKIEFVLRTLVVSAREEKNRNPRIIDVSVGFGEDGERESVAFFTSADPSPVIKRQETADAAYVLSILDMYGGATAKELYFTIDVEDEGDTEDSLRYAWVSTGGGFGNLRQKNQRWTPPIYLAPADEPAQEDEPAEHARIREDRNLYPIWVIVRDNGVENQLGQAWVEFYVRIVP